MKKILVIMISVLCILSLPVSASEFSDVPKNSPYYEAVDWLSNDGIISGYEDGTFRPGGTITRGIPFCGSLE